jgi:hypothetical protein
MRRLLGSADAPESDRMPSFQLDALIDDADDGRARLCARDPPGTVAGLLLGAWEDHNEKTHGVRTVSPQSENNSGGQAVTDRPIEGLRGRVVRQAQDVAPAETGKPAGPDDEQEAQGAHAPDIRYR